MSIDKEKLKAEIIARRGYWAPFHDGLLDLNPAFLDAYLKFQDGPARSGHLEPKVREFMQKTAPVNNVGKIKRPLFVVQGKNDPRVPAGEAEQMVAALKKASVPVWYLLAKDEGHGFAKKANADFQFYATVLFVQRHLLE